MNDEFRIEFEMQQSLCSTCKKTSNEYFEMVVHLRYKYFNNIDEIKKKSIEKVFKNFSMNINKLEENGEGFDIYFRNHGAGPKLLRIFSKDYLIEEKKSKTLNGKDQLTSKDRYRYFQSLVLVNIKRGDIVEIKGIEYEIKAINNNNQLILIHKVTRSKKVMSYSIIKDYFKLIRQVNKD